ncbi:MAG: cytochrome c [Limnohabitans sp.]|nr:cytochrome c [Limnohabitans sp.]
MKRIFLASFFTLALLSSCSKSSEPSISNTYTPTPSSGTKITYNANAKAIFDSNCIGCHPGSGQSPLNTYNTAKGNISNVIDRIQRTGTGVMPPSGQMSQDKINTLKQWQTDGLLEN